MARNVYGLDLGTYEIKIYDKKKDEIWKAKDVIAMKDEKYIFSVGDDAYEMYEKTPSNIEVAFPMRNGVIARFDDMQYLLLKLLGGEKRTRGAEYVLAVPTDVTEVEKRAFYDLVYHSEAKAASVRIMERGIADALGMGIDIWNEPGIVVANFGGETLELSVLASGGMVMNRLLQIGGIHFDNVIVDSVRHHRDFLIGRLTAETLRRRFGVFDEEADAAITVAGRSLITGVPGQENIPVSLVRAAMREPLAECVRAMRSMIDRTPPDVRRGINQNGICLTGGLSNMKGLATYIAESMALPVKKAENPEFCAVTGLKKTILSKEYKKLTYSMSEDYRWLR